MTSSDTPTSDTPTSDTADTVPTASTDGDRADRAERAERAERAGRTKVDLDELARLEEERRFLLRSIADLEREYAAGDVDQDDYEELLEGYTARAAAVLRTIEQGRAALPAKRRGRRGVVAAWVLGTIAVAVLAGWLLARSSGQRTAGQEMTGGQPADEVALALTEARALLGSFDLAGAFERFERVTEIDPENAEARTYTAWILVLNSRSIDDPAVAEVSLDAAIETFAAVVEDEPGYADAHCLYAVTSANFLAEPDLDTAREQGRICLESNPPTDMEGLVRDFLAGLDATTVPAADEPTSTSESTSESTVTTAP